MKNAIWFVLGGMAIVFATLAVLQGVMMALARALRPAPGTGVAKGGAPGSPGPRGAKTGGA